MPEGPEIRLAADKVARVLVDNRIETVGFGLPHLKRFEKRGWVRLGRGSVQIVDAASLSSLSSDGAGFG